MQKGIPTDATIIAEVELVNIKEKTGRFWNIGQKLVIFSSSWTRVSIRGVQSLGGHFACLCRGFDLFGQQSVETIFIHQIHYFKYEYLKK